MAQKIFQLNQTFGILDLTTVFPTQIADGSEPAKKSKIEDILDTLVFNSRGAYTPNVSNVVGTSNLTVQPSFYVGANIVSNKVIISFNVSGNCTALTVNSIQFSIPFGGEFTTGYQAIGNGTVQDSFGGSSFFPAFVGSSVGSTGVQINFTPLSGITTFIVFGTFTYNVQTT